MTQRKSLKDFIAENKTELDAAITRAMNAGRTTPLEVEKWNNNDRREWILNDEGLYRWTRSEGVRI